MSNLLEFYGTECPHCVRMQPLVRRLEKELGVRVERYEVWHSDENRKLMAQYDKDFCGGVPFYFNTKTGKWICGETSYDELLAWAGGS
ncbi:MAG: thioredoxin family protein [Candidatus Harrisonbacteria bacterium]|nr:thioredoxin family protein [Candidatus Harrisonbacteria bacterium]